ncbi:RNA-directed DNA polymerase [Microcoleus sp. F10_A2]
MKKLTELPHNEAINFFLKGSSYFNADFPPYISFEPVLKHVSDALNGGDYLGLKKSKPEDFSGVNYNFIANKDGRLAWRPLELMHPAIYVSLVNTICEPNNWQLMTERFAAFSNCAVECCSSPVISDSDEKDQASQIREWWQRVEQASLTYSLDYSHILHTDVTDCYGSLYTHSISWALHGMQVAKAAKGKDNLLGDKIDYFIRAGRYGQTNGISQGSVLMDFFAELVLGYVDELITEKLDKIGNYKILRYRDDYRIFTNDDAQAEHILKVVSDCLREVGMRLGVAKTYTNSNVIEGSIKSDKIAGIELQDLGITNAKTLQKQLLRLHSFSRRYPNSGALKRLLSQIHTRVAKQEFIPDDLEVQVAIATDIAVTSPTTFPVVAAILSHLISLETADKKPKLWNRVRNKMSKVPYNGYQEIWLQRVIKPAAVGIEFISDEAICKIVNGEKTPLWENEWIGSQALKAALDVSQIVIADASQVAEEIYPDEVALFTDNAFAHSG